MAQRPTALFFASFPPPFTGQRVASQRFYTLARAAFDVDKIEVGERELPSRASGGWSLKRALGFTKHVVTLVRRFRKEPIDVFYMTTAATPLGVLRDRAALWASRPHAGRVVAHSHNGRWAEIFEGRAAGSARKLVETVDAVLFLSETLAERAAAYVPAHKRLIVPNTIGDDLLLTAAEAEEKIEARRERDALRVLFLSNCFPSKGYAELGRALALLDERGVAFEADIAGGWPDPADRQAFEAELREAGLEARVRVLGPVTDRAEVRRLLVEADVFALPTTYGPEAQPLSIIEALNAATPVVATTHASIPDMVEDGVSGALVAPEPAPIADALEWLAEYDTWAGVARSARQRFVDDFSPGAVRRALVEALAGDRFEVEIELPDEADAELHEFAAEAEDSGAPILIHREEGSEAVLFAFGGYKGGLGFPTFEFFNSTKHFPVHRVYVRDPRQTWYHTGLPAAEGDGAEPLATSEVEGGVLGLTERVAEIVRDLGARRVVLLGNSMGGYAALAVGWDLAPMLEAEGVEVRVLSFAPQTFIAKGLRLRNRDPRWSDRMRVIHKHADAAGRARFDLREHFEATPSGVEADVYAAADHRLDALHAGRLEGVPGVRVHLHTIENAGHAVIRHLRDTGELETTLAEALGLEARG